MIDCHAHLADPAFLEDLPEVLDRAAQAGVVTVVCVCEGLADADRVLQLSRSYPQILPCLGLHPDRVTWEEAEAVCALIERHADRIVAVGEVGLDYWVARESREKDLQKEVLSRFVDLARRLDLPLNVHSRSAGHYTIDLLVRQGARRVLMHAFDGKASAAQTGVEAGFLFSVPPSLLRSPQKQKLVRRLPLSSLMLESDSPVLGPTGQERNEPRNIRLTAEAMADIKRCTLDEILETTSDNARRFFRLESRRDR